MVSLRPTAGTQQVHATPQDESCWSHAAKPEAVESTHLRGVGCLMGFRMRTRVRIHYGGLYWWCSESADFAIML